MTNAAIRAIVIIANGPTAAIRVDRLAAVLKTTSKHVINDSFPGDEATAKQVYSFLTEATVPVETRMAPQLSIIAKKHGLPAWALTRKREDIATFITDALPKLETDIMVRLAGELIAESNGE